MTKRQKLFCDEYLIDLNATQAAIRAGYSVISAGTTGSDLLKYPDVRARIDKALAERSRRTGVTADRVIQELAKVAFLNPPDVASLDDATVKEDATPEDTAAIASVRVKKTPGEYGTSVERELRFADKLKALEQLGKHLGIFTENIQLTGDVGVQIINDIPHERAEN